MGINVGGISRTNNLGLLAGLQEANRLGAQAAERIATGRRTNRAADDAAALTISQVFNAQVRGLAAADQNIQQGISLAQTADAGLGGIQEQLGRLRELAVEAANGTLTDQDRGNLNAEFGQVRAEIERVANATQFNGLQPLAGGPGTVIQAGANPGETATVPTANATTAALGINAADIGTQAGAAAAIGAVDQAINQVSEQRAEFGAAENRLVAAGDVASRQALEQAGAAARLTDANIAAELVTRTAAELRQRGAVAVLAQAQNTSRAAVNRLIG